MHRKLTEHGRHRMQNNELQTSMNCCVCFAQCDLPPLSVQLTNPVMVDLPVQRRPVLLHQPGSCHGIAVQGSEREQEE